jgi:hypothetical protein
MSMPIINLPLERIGLPQQQQEGYTYADDRGKDQKLTTAFLTVLGKTFKDTSFYRPGAWSYYYYPTERLNIADWLPTDILENLAGPEAEKGASEITTSMWVFALRNALSHGGIAYLDASGRQTDNQRIEMYLFASGKFDGKGRSRKLVGVHFLRISEANYRQFLRAWVGWLEASGFASLPVAA